MDQKSTKDETIREFRLTTFALKNKNTVLLFTALLVIFGFIAYKTMPMELFPEVNMPYIFVKTVYPGNAPVDMENLITRPLEKEINTINGIKELKSVSTQDNSDIFIEFNTGVNIDKALQDVKDAVDKAKSELPNDLDMDPMVMDFDFNEFPIISINLSGDFSLTELKDYAEYLKDELEAVTEISKVEIKGLDERQIQIQIDPHKLEVFELSFQDIEDAVNYENMTISGGDLIVDKTSRSIRTSGEFTNLKEIEDIVVKNENSNIVYLRDVAKVKDGFEDPLTYARLDRQPVVSLQVVKKAGENLIFACDKIFAILAEAKKTNAIPQTLSISLFNDQSKHVRNMVSDLENSIIMGILFVVGVLFFFLGFRNSLFVGVAIPMSMVISFVILELLGATVNMMVLFGLVLALGMLVDNAIVVVENIYRFIHRGQTLFEASKNATGEIAIPIISSTATTLAAFLPLIFWPGIMGEFMKYLPITLIIVLSASLFVALVIVPVLTSDYIQKQNEVKRPSKKGTLKGIGVMLGIGLLGFISGIPAICTLMVILSILVWCYYWFLFDWAEWFQEHFLSWLENFYLRLLQYTLKGRRPIWLLGWIFLSLLLVQVFFMIRAPKVSLMPITQPSFVNVFAELPVGTDIRATNDFMHKLEADVYKVIEGDKDIVEAVLTTVGKGVAGENETPIGNTPNKGMTTIQFVDFVDRHGKNTTDVLKNLATALVGKYPGVQVSVVKNMEGPPTGKPVSIEITGKDIPQLIQTTEAVRLYIESKNVPGIEGLKMDIDVGKPDLLVKIDRDKARRFGLSTGQIASHIRTSLFGKEVSDYKEGEDEYPIVMRLEDVYRYDISVLMNQKITFRSQSSGKIIQVPISAVASFKHDTSYASVNRKNMDKAITLWSNVIEGYNNSEINQALKQYMKEYKMPDGYVYKFTGEQEDQDETVAFLTKALLIALALIMLILVTQFNSFAKPSIIMASVIFSTIGVFGGLSIFKMDFIILMTGIGIISLAGVVVNNAIVLIDYTDYLKSLARRKLGLFWHDDLPIEESIECIVTAGKTRLRPVLLTAITTVLGLVPMAIGLNFNFETLLTELNPHMYFGGDNNAFWGPMSWTVIFGLTVATFLTLVVVPAMYLIGNQIKIAFKNYIKSRRES